MLTVFLGPFPGFVSGHSLCWAWSIHPITWVPPYCGRNIPKPDMPRELKTEQEKEPQQQPKERTENATQAYMR
ncbi:MAG: hypothetical protein IKV66_12080, partial [Clostridia bacterium]|nr:hypothetical protein [Clostridia bacterium]